LSSFLGAAAIIITPSITVITYMNINLSHFTKIKTDILTAGRQNVYFQTTPISNIWEMGVNMLE